MVDGPIDDLLEVLEQLRSDRTSLEPVLEELTELKRGCRRSSSTILKARGSSMPTGCNHCSGRFNPSFWTC